MPWIPLATAAIGAVQGDAQRRAQQNANQQAANVSAAQTEFSPWTHITPQGFAPQAPTTSGFGGAAQGALSGVMFGQQMKQNDLANEMMKKKMDMDAEDSFWNRQANSAQAKAMNAMPGGYDIGKIDRR